MGPKGNTGDSGVNPASPLRAAVALALTATVLITKDFGQNHIHRAPIISISFLRGQANAGPDSFAPPARVRGPGPWKELATV